MIRDSTPRNFDSVSMYPCFFVYESFVVVDSAWSYLLSRKSLVLYLFQQSVQEASGSLQISTISEACDVC